MATIRVRDWTKERIEEIRDAESHSSHDSVIKALLKDRELAQFAGTATEEESEPEETPEPLGGEKLFDDLTVLAELHDADNGIVFLWCPNCGKEIAHAGFEDSVSMAAFEVECQRCLTRLDQRAIVAIEIGYPIEERVVEETVESDLKDCVIDYWDRSLEALHVGELDDGDVDDERLIWRYNEYLDEFDWSWPTDIPAIGIQPGGVYVNEATGDTIEALERVTDNRGALDDVRIERTPEDGEESETEVLSAAEIINLVISRSLTLIEPPSQEESGTQMDTV